MSSIHRLVQAFTDKYAQPSSSFPAPVKEKDAGPFRSVPSPSPPPQLARPAAENIDSRESQHAVPDSRPEGPSAEEPEYDPDEEEYNASAQADLPEFPITHELILKDHTKVVSALALDPSGARILSGSHDYDCKLWDFGGMDQRCKPFKSWEPAESYHVSFCDACLFRTLSS